MTEHQALLKLASITAISVVGRLQSEASAERIGKLGIFREPAHSERCALYWDPEDPTLARRIFEPYEDVGEIAEQIDRYQYPDYRRIRAKLESTLRGLAGLQKPIRLPEIDRYRLDDYFIEIASFAESDSSRSFRLLVSQHDGTANATREAIDLSHLSSADIFSLLDP